MKMLIAVPILLTFASLVVADHHKDYVLWSGGVGQQERAGAPDKGTKLVFFEEGGPYLANVEVVVTDQNGNTLVDTVSKGPWVILDLPDGRYTVKATRDNQQREQEVITMNVGDSKDKYGLMFSAG